LLISLKLIFNSISFKPQLLPAYNFEGLNLATLDIKVLSSNCRTCTDEFHFADEHHNRLKYLA